MTSRLVAPPSVEQHIDTVDTFARTLYLRNKDAPIVADAVRQLHAGLRHLRVEVTDPDSPLSRSLYTNRVQILPLVDECGASLRQLADALDDGRRADQMAGTVRRLRERIDNVLDAVQLQDRASAPFLPNAIDARGGSQSSVALDDIKNKVDNVARSIFPRRDSGFEDDDSEDRLWREFQSRLEHEGFHREVLQKHRDLLRAYIRSLEAMQSRNDDGIENVQYAMPAEDKIPTKTDCIPPPVPQKIPLPELPLPDGARGNINDDNYKENKDKPKSCPPERSASTALILTRDLVEMDSSDLDVARHIRIAPQHQQQHLRALYGSPQQRYLLPSSTPGGLPEAPDKSDSIELSISPTVPQDQLSASPVCTTGPIETATGSPSFHLAPDSYGNEIPMDAPWTRISRDRVSPEVLERAGVRYEARRTYVAVLGRLSRDQIEDYARQTTDCRAARHLRHASASAYDKKSLGGRRGHENSSSSGSGSSGSSESDELRDSTNDDDGYGNDRGTDPYPYIVSPPIKQKTSPSSTVMPKSILKNKNENHVRFGPAYEMSPRSSATSMSDDERSRRRSHHHRDSRGYRNDYDDYGDKSQDCARRRRPRRYNNTGGSTYHDDRDRPHHRHHRHQDKDGHHDSYSRRQDHSGSGSSKKKQWGGTLGAVGIGGVAVSLLSVLAEAAGG
ncbi:hypothetical protein GMORB2_4454 [Geosmithia morbida]|uniref:DUF8035 domain-containing protein n=1 Tax=Geosmithia morbida TaxID=1094350 RepID=A0A9P4YQC8_9HYPO|nr:uncharacterized protein GMORB2_4454 [Geosmithia morbida]KAF4119788.1 hypothetical protein GMORB2_4454 [Geosmithia morbida]